MKGEVTVQRFILVFLICIVGFQFVIYQEMDGEREQRQLSVAEKDYLDMVGSSCRETVIWGEVFLDRADQLWTDLDEIKQTLSLDRNAQTRC